MTIDPRIHPLQTEFVKDKILNNAPTKELHDGVHQYGEEWVKDRLREDDSSGSYHGPRDLSKKRTVFFTFAEAAKKRICFLVLTLRINK